MTKRDYNSTLENFIAVNDNIKKQSPSPSKKRPRNPVSATSSFSGMASVWLKAAYGGKTKALSAFDSIDYAPSKITSTKKIPFDVVAQALQLIEDLKNSGSGSRTNMCVILTNLFRHLIYNSEGSEEVIAATYFIINKISADYEFSSEIGVGDGIVLKAICQVYGRNEKEVKKLIANGTVSDYGEVAAQSRCSQQMLMPPPPLHLVGVYTDLVKMAKASGKDSQQYRLNLIKKCLVSANSTEAKYLLRALQGKLRIGIKDTSVQQALSYARILTNRDVSDFRSVHIAETDFVSAEVDFKDAFNRVPNYDIVIPKFLDDPKSLPQLEMQNGIPIKPMLAHPTKSVSDVFDRFEENDCTAEYKYDGERAQVHFQRGEHVQVFSRNSENMTEKYPDIVKYVEQCLVSSPEISSVILDCEVVAYDTELKKILPFQVLSTRSRKNVEIENIKVHAVLFVFDLILFNGQNLCHLPLKTRRDEYLRSKIIQTDNIFYAKSIDILADDNREDRISDYMNEAINNACEGLMLKTLHSNYELNKRSFSWLKLKKDYLDGLTDSVDVIPIGAFYGKGKRTGTFGAYLLAIYDDENDEFLTTCKIGTGFTEEQLKSLYDELKTKTVDKKPHNYLVHDKMVPDVWLDPSVVWEILAADLSNSPVHTACYSRMEPGRGIALRFPRFIRVRDDKNIEDCTSCEQISAMYDSQFN